jgi:hypothetical protein
VAAAVRIDRPVTTKPYSDGLRELTPVPGSTLADADERSTLTFVALSEEAHPNGSRSTAARNPINQAILVAELSFPEPKKRLCACQRTPHNSERGRSRNARADSE